jgi:hypothetical protein
MLGASVIILLCALALGATAAVLSLRRRGAPSPVAVALAHAVLALGGYALLLWALDGPARGAQNGTGSFGAIAAGLFAIAVLLGLALLHRRIKARRLPGALVGIHASIAVAGFVILLAYAMLA